MPRESAPRRRHAGFTLIELLVVLGIIIILIGLLIPVISSVRKQSRAASTRQAMSRIMSGVNAYYSDFRAYPGPFAENQVEPPVSPLVDPPKITDPNTSGQVSLAAASGTAVTEVTSTENLFLGLEGGLTTTVDSTKTPPQITAFNYDPTKVGQGPQSLNVLSPKVHAAYATYADHETTITSSTDSNTGMCNNLANSYLNGPLQASTDSAIPEFIDQFTPAMPILYVRARAGRTINPPPGPPGPNWGIVSETAGDNSQQYNFTQLAPYTFTSVSGSDYAPPTAPPTPAGMPPYDSVTAYFLNPATQTTPRGKDGYILISAGQDSIFGTADDIVVSN